METHSNIVLCSDSSLMTTIISAVDGFSSTKQKVILHRFTTQWSDKYLQLDRDREREKTNYGRTRGKCRVKITFSVSWRHPIIIRVVCSVLDQTDTSDNRNRRDCLHLCVFHFFAASLNRVPRHRVWMWNRNATTVDATTCGLFGVNWFLWIFYSSALRCRRRRRRFLGTACSHAT